MYQGHKLGIVVPAYIVAPAYNEAKLIGATLDGMPDSADRIYVVDDGSTDTTLRISASFSNERVCAEKCSILVYTATLLS